MILVVGDFAYAQPIHDPMKFTGAASGITNLAGHRKILCAGPAESREVWFDIHICDRRPGPSGDLKALPTYIDALAKIAGGAKHKVVVFEYNSDNHAMRRALGNALATNADRAGRPNADRRFRQLSCSPTSRTTTAGIRACYSSTRTGLAPAARIRNADVLAQLPAGGREMRGGRQKDQLDVSAKRSDDGATLVLQVVNVGDQPIRRPSRSLDLRATIPLPRSPSYPARSMPSTAPTIPTPSFPNRANGSYEMKEGKSS